MTDRAAAAGNEATHILVRLSTNGRNVAPMTALLERDLVVVRQKAKIIEVTNQYKLQDADGNDIGAVNEVGQSKAKKAIRLLTKMDQYLTHKLEVQDADGTVVLNLVRPAKIMKSKIEVTDGSGAPIGTIVQKNVVGKKKFSLDDPAGNALGELQGESWVSWDFKIVDAAGATVGEVDKKFSGFLREGFTTADTYVVKLQPTLSGPLRSLAFAAAVAIDTALKQDD
jgi:uncharacterized protein YxjI